MITSSQDQDPNFPFPADFNFFPPETLLKEFNPHSSVFFPADSTFLPQSPHKSSEKLSQNTNEDDLLNERKAQREKLYSNNMEEAEKPLIKPIVLTNKFNLPKNSNLPKSSKKKNFNFLSKNSTVFEKPAAFNGNIETAEIVKPLEKPKNYVNSFKAMSFSGFQKENNQYTQNCNEIKKENCIEVKKENCDVKNKSTFSFNFNNKLQPKNVLAQKTPMPYENQINIGNMMKQSQNPCNVATKAKEIQMKVEIKQNLPINQMSFKPNPILEEKPKGISFNFSNKCSVLLTKNNNIPMQETESKSKIGFFFKKDPINQKEPLFNFKKKIEENQTDSFVSKRTTFINEEEEDEDEKEQENSKETQKTEEKSSSIDESSEINEDSIVENKEKTDLYIEEICEKDQFFIDIKENEIIDIKENEKIIEENYVVPLEKTPKKEDFEFIEINVGVVDGKTEEFKDEIIMNQEIMGKKSKQENEIFKLEEKINELQEDFFHFKCKFFGISFLWNNFNVFSEKK